MVRAATPGSATTRPRVVIVDDDPAVAAFVRVALEIDGYDVYEALSGPVGLSVVEAVSPVVVVLDVTMPGMDGVEVCRHIYTDHPGIQVLVMTGSADPALADRCRDAGAAAFLAKPVDSNRLSSAVAELVAVGPD